MKNLSYKDAKILVVDDVEEVLKSTKNSLVFEGMNVECINNPVEALEYMKNNKVDVLLLDFFMPEINGDVFVKKLREFNDETIVILRTGYSDQVPPLQIIENLNVQGYIDKLKGEDELILMTKAAIKTSFLLKNIKEKEQEIEFLNYRSSMIGQLITELVSDAESQIFSISGSVNMLESENADKDLVEIISKSNKNIQKMFRAIRFGSEENFRVCELEEILGELLKVKSKIDCIQLKFSSEISQVIIPGKIDILVFVLLEIYYYLKSVNSSEFNLYTVNDNGKIVMTIIHNPDYSDDFMNKINNLIKKDDRLSIVCDNFLKIVISI